MFKGFTVAALLTGLLMVLLVSGCGANMFKASNSVGGYTVDIQGDHNPINAGENQFQIAVSDQNGAVTDAQVKVQITMPAMPGMPAMSHTTAAMLSGKIYNADVEFMMAGSWTMSVLVERGGVKQKIDFSVDAH